MDREIESAVKIFEDVEKIRRGREAKLTHLAKNRTCSGCGLDFMPKKFEPCPECGSATTRLMTKNRKCKDCGHVWEPSGIGNCPWCGSPSSVENPKDDNYTRNVILPRLYDDEKFYEQYLRSMVSDHPAWAWASKVKGAGLTSVGRIIGKTDIKRINTCAAMWAHCGFGLNEDGSLQRKRAGAQINYDAQLQSNCIILGESLLKQGGPYYDYYLEQKELNKELKPAHRHNRAFRHMIKLFLSHFWQTWREAEGLPAPSPYAFSILKHPEGHFISPQDMTSEMASWKERHKKAATSETA